MQPLITLTIDGQTVSVPPGTTVLEAARQVGIEIPSLCYYAKLSKLGACRVCLVEVERMKALQTACTTPVRPEMVVYTNKPEIMKARRGMLEFLLTNHPLDCPVCDKGGECELQDLSFKYGQTTSRYTEERRHKQKALPLGPTVVMDEERCVLCRRCARYLDEWANEPQLDYMDRGRLTHLGTFPGHKLAGRFTGNVIDLCPVGALTSRIFRFSARSWELDNTPSVCSLCGVGCNLMLGVKSDKLRRITARPNAAVNDEWLCDKGRFAHGFVQSGERLSAPLVRRNGELAVATWAEALKVVSERLSAVVKESGSDAVGGLGSVTATNEANYLLQRFLRGAIGTNNVDHLGRLPDEAMPLDVARLAQADLVFLVGVDLAEEAPVVELLLRHETLLRDVKFVSLGPKRAALLKRGGTWLACKPGDEVAVLTGLAGLIQKSDRARKVPNAAEMTDWAAAFSPKQIETLTGVGVVTLKTAVEALAKSQNPLFLYGSSVMNRRAAITALNNLTLLLGAGLPAVIPDACNSRGALDMGAIPNWLPGRQPADDARVRDRMGKAWKAKLPPRPGLDLAGMKKALAEGRLKALYVMRSDPVSEAPGWAKALKAGAFIVVQDMFLTETAKLADVVLPSTSFAEAEGTFTNLAGRVQRVRHALPPQGQSRPDCQILTDLADVMNADFGYGGPEGVMKEIAKLAPSYGGMTYEALGEAGRVTQNGEGPKRLVKAEYAAPTAKEGFPFRLATGRVLYDGDVLLRQTPALDELTAQPYVEISSLDAPTLGIRNGAKVKVTSPAGSLTAVAHVTPEVRAGCVFVPLRLRDALAVSVLEDGPVTHVTVAPDKATK